MSVKKWGIASGLCVLVSLAQVSTCLADLLVSAASANGVMRFDGETGAYKGFFVQPGSGGLANPQGIRFGPDGNLYVSSAGSNNVLRYNGQTGAFIDEFATFQGMNFPAELNFRGGMLYVSDFVFNGRVSRFDASTGALVDHFVTGAATPDGQAWDADGNLYVSNFSSNSIRRYNGTTGAYINDFVAPNAGALSGPLDNLFLPNGDLLVSSFRNGSIKRYDANENFSGTVISGLSGGPQGLEIGPDGLLYVGDYGNGIIRRYDADTLTFIDVFATTNGQSTTNNFTFTPQAVPEPGQIAALLTASLGLALVMLIRRHRKPIKTPCADNHTAS